MPPTSSSSMTRAHALLRVFTAPRVRPSTVFYSTRRIWKTCSRTMADVEIPPSQRLKPIAEATELRAAPDKLQVVDHHQYETPDSLSPSSVLASPLDQFRTWFTSVQPYVTEPEAMSLCTVSESGVPSVRIVLLKQLDTRGFVFYTNYGSRKSHELAETSKAALAFYWREVHRQVRVVGRVERLDKAESEAYFRSRPLGSRIGAWASAQSEVVRDGELEERIKDVKERFGVKEGDKDVDIPLPEFWGGWRIIPDEVEFWLGKPSRLHDRVRYIRKEGSDEWIIEKLSP